MTTTFDAVKQFATNKLPGLCIGIEAPNNDVNWVAELLRRINYCPNAADLGDTHSGWSYTLKTPIKDPKLAAVTYKRFVNAMSGDMLDKVLQHLQGRVKAGSGVAPAMVAYVAPSPPEPEPEGEIDPDEPLVATLDDAMQINGVAPGSGRLLRTRVEDESVDAVVDRLLAVAPVDNPQWGAW
jgi:hypothetical protein